MTAQDIVNHRKIVMPERPNFLIIMAEQFSARSDPSYVDFPVRAPSLERLARTSTRFENAYCNSPVCGPSRMSFLTGRFVCNHGAYDNGSQLASHVPTFAHILTRGGYQTVMCGRMHMHGYDQKHGFERRLCAEIANPYPENPADFPKPFEPIAPLKKAPPRKYEPSFSDNPIFTHDEYVTPQAQSFLSHVEGSGDKRPFCLTVGYLAAHGSLQPLPLLKPLYEKYIGRDDLPIANFTEQDYERLPDHIKRITYNTNAFDKDFHRHQMAQYLARVTYLDRQVGLVLDTLEEAGLAGNTVVMFVADHGEGMGRHGQWGKMFFYEEAQKVPLYARLPGEAKANVVPDRVSLVDFLPTLADLAGCEVPVLVDGHSFAPLLCGEPGRAGRDVVFSEYHGYRSVSDMYMVIHGDHKYCHYLREPGELYNLRDDPAENQNLIGRPELEPVRKHLEALIRQRVDIETTAERIRQYNLQRQTVTDAIAASPLIGPECYRHIREYRQRINEPWWDGGAYCAQWERHLYAATGNPFEKDTPTPARGPHKTTLPESNINGR